MQLFRSFLLLAVLATAPCLMAQDAASPADSASDQTTSEKAAELFPSGGVPSPSPTPHPNGGGGHHNGGGNHPRNGRHHDLLVSQADSDPLEVRVAYRRAKTVALARDPGLAVLIHQADAAPTDVDKRSYLKAYYTQLFASVRKIDPSPAMKAHVELLNAVAEQRYDPKRREVGGDEDLVNGRGRGRRGRVE